MKWNKHFYHWYYYTQAQKRGFILLLCLIIVIQGLLYLRVYIPDYSISSQEQDTALHTQFQIKVDSLRLVTQQKKDTIYPFNPNYMTDFKGYTLGLTTEEIDRLLAFRAAGHYVNSKEEFQKVTHVSTAWMTAYGSYFKFSTWKQSNRLPYDASGGSSSFFKQRATVEEVISIKDINQATADDLQLIRGIGPAFAKRIIADRTKYGGYVHIDQVKFVYGLPDQVIEQLLQHYAILENPTIELVALLFFS